ncbi:nickel-binding protein [Chitinophaga sp. SYP-B3965]|uniref:nickel-binding protein n=1 Tax=Chitinophaga sp. SYP-B3965 TaxID=2663120 RepID=UPI001566ACE2|nr:nickel-binding protein [Chitinophaga sp. SYP-B3965]
MDLHKAADYSVKPTVEEIKHNHIADLAVQQKYHVKFLQYWINEEAGLVFCMMEAPDKESCVAVHREAHGAMPCNIIELQGGDYQAFMGDDMTVNTYDIVERADGTMDTGYRIILITDIISVSEASAIHETIEQLAGQSGGRFIQRPGNRLMMAFSTGQAAMGCATDILRHIPEKFGTGHELRIGIGAGEPVTEQHELFADTIKLANRLCDIAQNGQIVIAPLVIELTKKTALQQVGLLKILNNEDERFLHQLIDNIHTMLQDPGFSIDVLSKKLGTSRSQLYRKITGLTGYSANSFIRELRLQKALQLIRSNYGNITQVAMEVGFTNPSYFAKNFQDRFGISPLKVLKSWSENSRI